MRTKAQLTAEHLLILSVLIILTSIALVIITSGPDNQMLQRNNWQNYWATTDVGIMSIHNDGSTIRMNVINNLHNDIIVTKIFIDNIPHVVGAITLGPKETFTYNISHIHDFDNAGNRYSLDFSFEYNVPLHSTSYTFIGQTPVTGTITLQIP